MNEWHACIATSSYVKFVYTHIYRDVCHIVKSMLWMIITFNMVLWNSIYNCCIRLFCGIKHYPVSPCIIMYMNIYILYPTEAIHQRNKVLYTCYICVTGAEEAVDDWVGSTGGSNKIFKLLILCKAQSACKVC